ncbi:hypothetical protein CVT24_006390 [Panaeolus cyanescens]|uniref:Methyltransferase type 11 domain-containing protein n=1 Tax=Panaeolus cyanescens TaxID=181874 RepID=A0A409WBQ3_9AGAR|nr:hypothetical protein CVT24_006390 [Panaeolus cyanescens]
MKLSKALEILMQIIGGIAIGLPPTVISVLRRPWVLFNPREISNIFMSHVWMAFLNGIDQNEANTKRELLYTEAYGVVLDIGAGHGHAVQYLDPSRVTRYIALEPNTILHDKIREKANKAGFFESDGRLTILGCGAEDTHDILAALRNSNDPNTKEPHPVDTLVSIFTLCSVPNVETTIKTLVGDVLKPGGLFLYYEHVKSPRADVVWWQQFWTPFWSGFFGGCCLDRPTDKLIEGLRLKDGKGGSGKRGAWKEHKQWENPDQDPEELFKRTLGRFVKA